MTTSFAKVLALLMLGVSSRVMAQSPGVVDSNARAVDRLFDAWRDTTPGCVVGIARHGQTLYEHGYGMADIESALPMRTGTIVHAASLAKQFTAMSVLLLAREGKLSLDDDIHRFLPELKDYGVRITIRDLLHHTSGLRDFFEMLILARGRFEEDRITNADMRDVVLRQSALNSRPGAEYIYTNTGYALVGLIVQRASGQSLRDFAAARIFGPLGMSHTSFRDDVTALVPGRAEGYARRGTGWRSSIPNYDVNGSTNLLTTVGDLLIWSENLDHPRVGDSSIVALMSTSGVLANGDSTGYGFGLSLAKDRGARVVEHEGRDPGFRAYLGRYVDHGLAIALLCNAPVNPVGLGHDIAAIYLSPLLRPVPPQPIPPPMDEPRATAARAGVYFRPGTLDVVELAVRDGRLFVGNTRFYPMEENRYQLGDRPIDIVFEPGPRAGYRVHSRLGDRQDSAFEWRAPATFKAGDLRRYAGRYASTELNSTYDVSVADSVLFFRTGTSEGLRARPVFTDAFVSGQIFIQFVRKNARIAGFEISHPRARRLLFVKEERRK